MCFIDVKLEIMALLGSFQVEKLSSEVLILVLTLKWKIKQPADVD